MYHGITVFTAILDNMVCLVPFRRSAGVTAVAFQQKSDWRASVHWSTSTIRDQGSGWDGKPAGSAGQRDESDWADERAVPFRRKEVLPGAMEP
jgi:hypothetical protein